MLRQSSLLAATPGGGGGGDDGEGADDATGGIAERVDTLQLSPELDAALAAILGTRDPLDMPEFAHVDFINSIFKSGALSLPLSPGSREPPPFSPAS